LSNDFSLGLYAVLVAAGLNALARWLKQQV
jgi:hypothetical protein